MSNHLNEPPVPDPWPTPPTIAVLTVAGIAHVIITAGAVIAINALNGSQEANAQEANAQEDA